MKTIMIEDANLDRLDNYEWPPGVNSMQAKVNYAVGLGLDVLEKVQTTGPPTLPPLGN